MGDGATAVHLDLQQPESFQRLVALLEQGPPVDALVNNAGASLGQLSPEVAKTTIEINTLGPLALTDAVLPRMSPTGNVVMVSSGMGSASSFSEALRARLLSKQAQRSDIQELAAEFVAAVSADHNGLGGFPRNAYSVSKALLNTATRILAGELGSSGSGIKVNAVCPGWVRTRMGGRGASRSVESGASGILWAATLPEDGPTGAFFRDGKRIEW